MLLLCLGVTWLHSKSGWLKCPRNSLLHFAGELFHRMSHAACFADGLVTRLPPLPAHPHSSGRGDRWWDAARHLDLHLKLSLSFSQCTWATSLKSRQEKVKITPSTYDIRSSLLSNCSSGHFRTSAFIRNKIAKKIHYCKFKVYGDYFNQ